jgi:hypothetical protein
MSRTSLKSSFSHGPTLARLFSAAVVKELAATGRSPLAAAILKEAAFPHVLDPATPLWEFFDQVYALLFRSYRNEYIYKNVIAQKILLGVHSLTTTCMLTEFRAGNCKADTVLLNGTSAVYEIKSAYDSIERLARQITAYRQVFDNINVITSESQAEKVSAAVEKDIGLMVLTDRNTIRTVRAPVSLKHSTQPSVIFDSLRRNEYEQIIECHFGTVPHVSNARIYQACRDLFSTLSPGTAHDAMVTVLKKRGNNRGLNEFVASVPASLKALSLSCRLNNAEQVRFSHALNSDVGDCFSLA